MNDVTLSTAARQGARVWRFLEVVGTIGAIAVTTLLASGWRVQKPSEVIGGVEATLKGQDVRITKLEAHYDSLSARQQTSIRLQCLATTRRDANLAGACNGLPTRDDSPRTTR